MHDVIRLVRSVNERKFSGTDEDAVDLRHGPEQPPVLLLERVPQRSVVGRRRDIKLFPQRGVIRDLVTPHDEFEMQVVREIDAC
jgi:hypothetical protein